MKTRLVGLFAALGLFALLALPATASHGIAMPTSVGEVFLTTDGKTAFVRVTFTCPFAGRYLVIAELSQTSGRLPNSGQGDAAGYCRAGDEVTNRSVPLDSQFGSLFKVGPAQVTASVELLGPYEETDSGDYRHGETTAQVRIKWYSPSSR